MSEPPDHHRAAALWAAAVAAELQTGEAEQTRAEAEQHILVRFGLAALGFVLIAVGIAALPLPGPGWLIIIAGLSLLPFAWAQRMVRLIRARVPGVPEEGSIPLRTWLLMGGIVVVATVSSIFLRDTFAQWFSDAWTSVWDG